MSKNKKKDNFNQAMYEMFGIGKDNGTEPAETDEQEEFLGSDPLSKQEESAVVVEAAVETKPETKPEVKSDPIFPAEPVASKRGARATYLAEGSSFEGTLRSDSDVEICGEFKGELVSKGKVILHANTVSNVQAIDLSLVGSSLTGDAVASGCVNVDESSSITGNISAQDVVCSGQVRGNLDISGNLTLSASAKIFGDIKAATLVVERGAKVTGKMEMSAN